ncbi:Uncharacterised protein [Mycobacteroides abscessus subsp. abscessus]|nr:Uncharacterised protein [Mycobacteroides abscessus subsp. abscessus]
MAAQIRVFRARAAPSRRLGVVRASAGVLGGCGDGETRHTGVRKPVTRWGSFRTFSTGNGCIMGDLIGRIDDLLDDGDDDIPWSDSWRSWGSTAPWDLGDSDDDGPLDGGWDYYPDTQIHVIPVEQVGEWTRWLNAMPRVEREDVQWYVVCFTHKVAGERSVDCGCGNPSSTGDSR